jgi:hypothetical protein
MSITLFVNASYVFSLVWITKAFNLEWLLNLFRTAQPMRAAQPMSIALFVMQS